MLAAIGLMACGDPPVTHGIVTSREHQPEWTTYSQRCVSYDAKGGCAVYMQVPNTWPEHWDLCLRDDSVDRAPKDQPTGCVEVTEQEWGSYHVGDRYPKSTE